MTRRLGTIVIAMALLAGCGKYTTKDASDVAPAGSDAVGSGLLGETTTTAGGGTTTTTTAGSGVRTTTTRGAGPTSTTSPLDTSAHPRNAKGELILNRTLVHRSGFTLDFGMDGKLSYASDEDILFDFVVTNDTSSMRWYDTATPEVVILDAATRKLVWHSLRCTYTGPGLPPGPLEPHVATPLRHTYPFEEECRLPPGRYIGLGTLPWCGGTPDEPDCSDLTRVNSDGLHFTIRP